MGLHTHPCRVCAQPMSFMGTLPASLLLSQAPLHQPPGVGQPGPGTAGRNKKQGQDRVSQVRPWLFIPCVCPGGPAGPEQPSGEPG